MTLFSVRSCIKVSDHTYSTTNAGCVVQKERARWTGMTSSHWRFSQAVKLSSRLTDCD